MQKLVNINDVVSDVILFLKIPFIVSLISIIVGIYIIEEILCIAVKLESINAK